MENYNLSDALNLPPEKEGGKRIPITAKTKERLEKKLIDYYKKEDERIVKIPLKDLTVMELKTWYINTISNSSLTRKRFYEVKFLANMILIML